MKAKILFLAALTALPVCAEDDYGIWTQASLQKDLTKKVAFNGGVELRANDKLGEISRYGLSAGLTFKPQSFLHFGATYSFIRDYNASELKEHFEKNDDGELELEDGRPVLDGYNHYDAYWRNKHRISLDATGKVQFGRFTLSLRERYQYTRYAKADVDREKYRLVPASITPDNWTGDKLYPINGRYALLDEADVKTKAAKDSHILRSRVKLEYNIKGLPLNPYASYEFNNDIDNDLHLDKTRFIVGTELKITKQHRFDIAYLFQKYNDSNDKLHALSISYKFKF